MNTPDSLPPQSQLSSLASPFGIADIFGALSLLTFFGIIVKQSLEVLAAATAAGQEIIPTMGGILASSVTYASIVFFILIFLAVRGIFPVRAFGLRRPDVAMLKTILLLLFLSILLILFAQFLVGVILDEKESPQPIILFWLSHTGLIERGVVILMAVIIAPLCEEIIFRGYFYGVAKRYLGTGIAAIFISAVFAVVHLHWPALPGLFIFSIALIIAYEKTRSLTSCILLHASFNALSLILSLLFPDWV